MTNERDVEGIREVFAVDGTWTCVIDGLKTYDAGVDAIAARWGLLCGFMADRRLFVEKELVAATDDTIVNLWRGTTRSGANPIGIEVWRFDTEGRVRDQLLTGFLDPRPDTSLAALLGVAVSQPANAVTFARHRFGGRGR